MRLCEPDGWDDRDGLVVVAFGTREVLTAGVVVVPAVGVG